MFEDHNDTIYETVQNSKTLSDEQLDELNESHLSTGKSLANAVIDAGLIERAVLLQAIAEFLSYDYLEEVPSNISEIASSAIRPNVARMYAVVPLECDNTSIRLLACDPFNSSIIDDLTFSLNKDVSVVVADPRKVQTLLTNSYGEEDSSIDDLLGDLGEEFASTEAEAEEMDPTDMANQTPIIRFVNLVLQQAIKDKASDIHFEPFEDEFRIRYRIDGALYEMAPPPKNLAVPVISRVKVLSNMNISETRIPQDGRIKMTIAGVRLIYGSQPSRRDLGKALYYVCLIKR